MSLGFRRYLQVNNETTKPDDQTFLDIEDLIPDAANPRLHPERNVKILNGSLKRFGAARSIVIDKKGVVRAGNATLEAAKAAGITKARIVKSDGKTLVVVQRDDWDETEAVTYSITDNHVPLQAQWNKDVLPELLQALPDDLFQVTGFNEEDLAKILAESGGEIPDIDEGGPEGVKRGSDIEEDIPSLEQRFGPLPPRSGLKAPFPWFGGKSRIAPLVWKRFGDVQNYVEPFAGSLAVLLDRPTPFEGSETVNDLDGLVCNFWRALKASPEEVARYSDWPVIENDLHARHAWLVDRKDSLQPKLEGDPDYFDPKIAGWWVWGICCWIGGGWCEDNGPWVLSDGPDGVRVLRKSDKGNGLRRKRPDLGGRGVHRKRPQLGNSGQGINSPSFEGDTCDQRTEFLISIMSSLADRLRRVRVCCGDWSKICGGKDGDSISSMIHAGGECGVLLDPPYADTAGRDSKIYRKEDLQVAHAVRDWAVSHGDDERFRIALCGYEGEHEIPSSWECVEWKAHGGMSYVGGDDTEGRENARRERIWFSPHCVR